MRTWIPADSAWWRNGTLALLSLLVSSASMAEKPALSVEPTPGPTPGFRLWNPTPHPAVAGRVRVAFLRRDRVLDERVRSVPALAPFASWEMKVGDWRSFAPARVRVCVIASGSTASCAERALPGTRPDLRIGRARVDGGQLIAELRNEGDVASGPFDVRVTTRAAARLVGTATERVASLPPRSTREQALPLERWGATTRSGGVAFAADCCTIEVVADPEERIDEADEANNRLRLEHAP